MWLNPVRSGSVARCESNNDKVAQTRITALICIEKHFHQTLATAGAAGARHTRCLLAGLLAGSILVSPAVTTHTAADRLEASSAAVPEHTDKNTVTLRLIVSGLA